MDIVTLARIQFAMTTVFHYFFVPFSIGTGIIVAIMETMYVVKKNDIYLKMAKFWAHIFLLSFAVGVVTGLIQEFQFGMNWSEYSRFVGDIFGAPLAVEALLAFFLESTFIGLWLFTWNKVSPKLHVTFIWLVVFGTFMSAFWILVANAFMQHPVGYTINNGRAEMTDFVALFTSHQVWYEFTHVLSGAIIMGGMTIAGMSAIQMFRQKSMSDITRTVYKKSMRIGFLVGLIGSFSILLTGDLQMKALVHDQPMKFAATEGLYEDSGDPAAWTVIAWMNTTKKERVFGVEVPYMLSILSYNKPSGYVKGMNTVEAELVEEHGDGDYFPPVNTLFWTFRVMAGIGMLTLLVSSVGLLLTRKKNAILYETPWMLWVVGATTITPFLANTSGWLVTELGRYPWTVYGLFKIEDSVSPNVSATSLLISNITYFTLFVVLGGVMVYFVNRQLHKGPEYAEELAALEDKAATDPFDGGGY